ncbi:PRC-barrel domain-containing protein [Loktanella sp. SALINAS62]|uniref:PRC-barrel domain-containing protein n=1 Tax=Loktanella sp. SALINAS62 TaxID=2706124 RepID=UPI001B8DA203|nr:PRC-barrel domain-containing protein [Loktanella sp. SALINAS62]MBS1303299.1 PRC-barrel domain containing protein [Loktanella sp. SALINAS62]
MNALTERLGMRSSGLVVSIILTMTVPAATAQEQTEEQDGADRNESIPEEWQSSHILLTPSRHLIEQNLLDEGEDWGKIKFLMIDISDGNLIYALASTERTTGQFIVVPWNVIEATDWTGLEGPGLSVDAPAELLENARRFDMDDIVRLTTPNVAVEVGDYFTTAIDPIGLDSPVFVLGHELVGTIAPPATQVANQLEGTNVTDADGTVIGAIDDIMVDVDVGQVPYLLVSTGDYPGSQGDWWPIPPQALTWDAATESYTIDQTEAELRELGLFGEPELPISIRQSQLDNLYDFFGLDPYNPEA